MHDLELGRLELLGKLLFVISFFQTSPSHYSSYVWFVWNPYMKNQSADITTVVVFEQPRLLIKI